MKLGEVLNEFGLIGKENEVYLAVLELGQTTVIQIAKKIGMKRPTVYDILANLINRGFLGQTLKGKKRLFYAESPEKLEKLLDEKRSKLLEIMPMLKSLYNTAGEKPKIRYYEGVDGLKEVYRDTLSYEGTLVAFVSENIIQQLGEEFVVEYTEKRKKAKIFVRAIGPDTTELIQYKKDDEEDLKVTRLVPAEKFPFTIEMNVYGNKLAFMSFKEGMGIIIESNEIARNMKLMFELAWMGARN